MPDNTTPADTRSNEDILAEAAALAADKLARKLYAENCFSGIATVRKDDACMKVTIKLSKIKAPKRKAKP